MKLETFFEKFDQFADAPDAVAKMRELVLELASTGKLYHANSTEWKECTLGDVIELISGQHLLGNEHNEVGRGIPYLTGPSDFGDKSPIPTRWTDQPKVTALPGDILITVKGSGVGKTNVLVDQLTAISRQLMAIRVMGADPEFVHIVLKRAAEYFQNAKTGIAIPGIGRSDVLDLKIVLPPLAEQKRIVAKVDELMALCDRLEAQQQERETRHAALARAALARFADAPTPANLPFLFHASFTISPSDLRKSILTLAVQGKLVPQDTNDEPAGELSKSDEELVAQSSFEIPHGWIWNRLTQLADINGGFAFKSTDYTDQGTRVVRISDFDEFGFKDHKVVRHPFTPDLKKFSLVQNNILMAMTGGTVGKSHLVKLLPEPMVVNQRVAAIKILEGVNPNYIDIVIRSEMTQEVIRKVKNSTNDNISMGDIKGFAIPLPPLAEQRRIVAKVDELMALVDALETQLTTARATAANLLDAIVAELTGTTRDPRSATRSSSSTPGTGRRGRPRKTA